MVLRISPELALRLLSGALWLLPGALWSFLEVSGALLRSPELSGGLRSSRRLPYGDLWSCLCLLYGALR
eukprot:13823914-Alexandrium_andersonii.AAC.1